jgi:hypothetical protein
MGPGPPGREGNHVDVRDLRQGGCAGWRAALARARSRAAPPEPLVTFPFVRPDDGHTYQAQFWVSGILGLKTLGPGTPNGNLLLT